MGMIDTPSTRLCCLVGKFCVGKAESGMFLLMSSMCIARRGHYPEWRTAERLRVAKFQPSSTIGKGDCNRPAPAILLALHFLLCMTLGTHTSGQTQDFEDAGMH